MYPNSRISNSPQSSCRSSPLATNSDRRTRNSSFLRRTVRNQRKRGRAMYVSRLLELTTRSEEILADAFRNLAAAHPDEPDIRVMGMEMARECSGEVEELKRLTARYPADLGDRLD